MIWAMPKTESQRSEPGGNYARFFGVGFAFVAAIGVLAVAGYFLDRALGTLPLFLLLGLGTGFIVGLYQVYSVLKRWDRG